MSERHFRRLRDRYEAEGAAGLVDRRLGRASGRRAPLDQIEWVLEQYRTRYWDFTAKHFHEHLVRDHGFRLGYTWTKIRLQEAGLVKKARGRGAHRKRRPRRALPGMLLFQDGSPHRWLVDLGRDLDLIATMDDATGEVVSAFLVEEEGTFSSFRGLRETIEKKGPLLRLLHRPRQPLLPQPQGRRQGRQGAPDPGRPGPRPARHRAHPLLLARGQGAHRAALRHPARAPPPGAASGRHRRHGRGQPLYRRDLPARLQ